MVNEKTTDSPLTTHHSQTLVMLKYIKNYAASIKDIDIYPVFSLLVFVLFFAAMLYLVKRMDKQRAEDLRHMPLDLEPETTNTLNTVKQA